ncbi:MAG: hypothetical protein ACK4XJ_08130 [Fimbriimonadaceae bacterium]
MPVRLIANNTMTLSDGKSNVTIDMSNVAPPPGGDDLPNARGGGHLGEVSSSYRELQSQPDAVYFDRSSGRTGKLLRARLIATYTEFVATRLEELTKQWNHALNLLLDRQGLGLVGIGTQGSDLDPAVLERVRQRVMSERRFRDDPDLGDRFLKNATVVRSRATLSIGVTLIGPDGKRVPYVFPYRP